MFERFSFSLSRLFRFRGRLGARADARRSTVRPPVFTSRPPAKPQLEPISTTHNPNPSITRTRPPFDPSVLSPIAQSPITPLPGATPAFDASGPILIIGRDSAVQPILPSSTAHVLSGDVGAQGAPPNTRQISFQLLATRSEERPSSPVSMCSTLVPEAQAGTEITADPPERSLAPEAPDHSSFPAASAESDIGLDNAVRSGSGRTRPVSLFSPQPVRAGVNRFSLPVTPTTPTMATSANVGVNRRESKRMSLRTLISRSNSNSPKKEKRTSRWSRELERPETQELLRALAMRI